MYQVCTGQCLVIGDEGVVAQDTGHPREVQMYKHTYIHPYIHTYIERDGERALQDSD